MDPLTPAQRYYQNHREKRREYGREYYAKNKDRILENLEKRKEERDRVLRTLGDYKPPEPPSLVVEEERQISPIKAFKRRGIPMAIRENVVVEFK